MYLIAIIFCVFWSILARPRFRGNWILGLTYELPEIRDLFTFSWSSLVCVVLKCYFDPSYCYSWKLYIGKHVNLTFFLIVLQDKRKDAVKKVIAAMTVGKDVSSLFTDVVNCMQTENLELKKLVYLYLINYAKSQPDLAILAVNTFVKVKSGITNLSIVCVPSYWLLTVGFCSYA